MEFSGPRAGTTNFAKLLSGHSDVLSYGEMFNSYTDMAPRLTGGFLSAAQDLGIELREDQLRKKAFLVQNPVEAIRIALRHAEALGKRLFHFKVARWNFGVRTLSRIVDAYRPRGLVIYRAPIDTFTSLTKARHTGEFGGVDTTSVKPNLDVEAFLSFRARQQRHYQICKNLFEARGLPYAYLSYEETYGAGADPLAVIQAKLADLHLDPGVFDESTGMMPRQDSQTDRAKKVANWDAFVAVIEAKGMRKALYAYDFDDSGLSFRLRMAIEKIVPKAALAPVKRFLFSYRRHGVRGEA